MDDLCDDADGIGIRVKEFLRKHFKGQRSPKAIVYLRRTNEMFRNDDDLFKYMKKVAQKRRGKSKLSQELVRVTELSDTESDMAKAARSRHR
ncbi:hypothetical protein NQ176_g9418 [Zarea fungicola]|uniref:Uncharacterized protein n=1 Tax=Zarea fungicola TaxID=93591 RepID=A0ACC1MMT9_9HYPO|nr:hypothetical protein NQ176_g9418 [Lecanicillium fungicola]